MPISPEINFGSSSYDSRCETILPTIDDALALASEELLNLAPGDNALDGLTVSVPKSCTPVTKREVLNG